MYKICFVVADDGAEADFVFFDRVGRELVSMMAFAIRSRKRKRISICYGPIDERDRMSDEG
jgi:hypothetical protein